MEFLKQVFGDQALTYEELEEALRENKEIKLANLAEGKYVAKEKLESKIAELHAANDTIKKLNDSVSKFDGIDLEKMKDEVKSWEKKYQDDISKLKRDNAIDLAILQANGRNPKAIKALLKMDEITLKEDGTLEGCNLDALKETDGYLFETPKLSGIVPSNNSVEQGTQNIAEQFTKALQGI